MKPTCKACTCTNAISAPSLRVQHLPSCGDLCNQQSCRMRARAEPGKCMGTWTLRRVERSWRTSKDGFGWFPSFIAHPSLEDP